MNLFQTIVARVLHIPSLERVSISVLELKPGQTLVISIENYSRSNADKIGKECRDLRLVPEGFPVIVKANSTHLTVIDTAP